MSKRHKDIIGLTDPVGKRITARTMYHSNPTSQVSPSDLKKFLLGRWRPEKREKTLVPPPHVNWRSRCRRIQKSQKKNSKKAGDESSHTVQFRSQRRSVLKEKEPEHWPKNSDVASATILYRL